MINLPFEIKDDTNTRIQKVLDSVKQSANFCRDETISFGYLKRKDSEEGFVLDGKEILVSPHAEGQLLNRLNIPAGYIHKCSNPLQAYNVNYWLDKFADREAMLRYYNDKVRAIFSGRYVPIDDKDLLPVVMEGLKQEVHGGDLSDLQVKYFDKNEDFTVLQVLYHSLKTKQNDYYYRAGVHISNSETGLCAIWIKPIIKAGNEYGFFNFIDRNTEGATSFRHLSELNPEAIKNAICVAKKVSEIGVTRLMQTTSEMITNPTEEINKTIKSANFLPNRLVTILEDEYKEKQEVTKFEFARSILRAVQELPTFKKYLAEMEVGRYLKLFQHSEKRMKNVLNYLTEEATE